MSETSYPATSETSIEVSHESNFNWTVNEVLGEAWEKQSGFKGSFWGAMLIYLGINFVLGYVQGMVFGREGAGFMLSQLAIAFATYPMAAGLIMLGVKRAAGLPVRFTMLFDYYSRIVPIFLLYLCTVILTTLGFVLLILPGIYLMVAYSLALPLMVEKNLGIWEAMETSRKAITQCWFRMFGLMLLMLVIILISIIPLGLGLIWTLPTLMLVMGTVYREIFGVDEAIAV